MFIILQNRYREFMRISRIWRDLKLQKHYGYGHDINNTPGPGDLALFCAACPQPGINIPDNWKNHSHQYVTNILYKCS